MHVSLSNFKLLQTEPLDFESFISGFPASTAIKAVLKGALCISPELSKPRRPFHKGMVCKSHFGHGLFVLDWCSYDPRSFRISKWLVNTL